MEGNMCHAVRQVLKPRKMMSELEGEGRARWPRMWPLSEHRIVGLPSQKSREHLVFGQEKIYSVVCWRGSGGDAGGGSPRVLVIADASQTQMRNGTGIVVRGGRCRGGKLALANPVL